MAVCINNAIYEDHDSFAIQREFCKRCGACVDVCVSEARAIVGNEMTTEEVMKEIRKDVTFYHQSGGGATFSGGEPLLQHAFLLTLLQACQQEGIRTTVDTTGFTSAAVLKTIAEYVDLFLYDLKIVNDEKHRLLTGVSNQLILGNLQLLADLKKKVIVRVPLLPGLNDDEEAIRSLGEFVSTLTGISEINLLPYHRSGVEKYQRIGSEYQMASLAPPDQEKLQSVARTLHHYVPHVNIGGQE